MMKNNSQIQLTALGGLGETGSLNCMLYETATSAILVDCGVGFPGPLTPGVNVMVPDLSALEAVRHKLQALVFTHGHEDHVGAVTHCFRHFPLPIYATPFTQGVVRQKFKETAFGEPDMHALKFSTPVKIGDFTITPQFVNHSILDTVALLIQAQGLSLMHLTDFKIDLEAPEGRITDLKQFEKIGDDGLDLLLMDSTNALSPGWTASEKTVKDNLGRHLAKISGRVLVCLFASNILRLQSVLDCAVAAGRTKVAFTGRSTREYSSIAKGIDRLRLDGVELLDVEDLHEYPDDEILVIVTGSQAEPRSVLQRISQNAFKPFPVRQGDVILMSSKMIPGNEGQILAMINRLTELGAKVVFDDEEWPIHSSGHAKQEELKRVFETLRPRCFIPIHGEYLHLQRHVELAVGNGVRVENARLTLNGETVALSAEGLKRVGELETGKIFLTDENLEIEENAIGLRKRMAQHGLVAVSVMLRGSGKFAIELVSQGLIGEERERDACLDLRQDLLDELKKQDEFDLEKIQKLVKVKTRQFFREKFHMRPEVVVLVHE